MKAVILAAGEGTRLEPLTLSRPKPMLPVANRPLLEYVVEAVRAAGIDEVVFVVGYKRERIQNHFGDGEDWNVSIEYAVQEKQLGTGHAILQAEPYVDGPFVALNGDRIIDPASIETLVERQRETDDTVMSVVRVDDPTRYGMVELDGRRVTSIVEKPPAHAVTSNLINAGAYGFDRDVFEAIRETTAHGELAITDTLAALADSKTVSAVRFSNRWFDVSYLWDMLAVNSRVLDEDGGQRSGAVTVHDSAVVDEPVALDRDVRIRPSAVVLPGTALGANVDVGANAVVKNSVVLPDATIEDGAVVRDCIVGANATVGANTTVAGGLADVTADGVVHEDVRLGGVVGDNARLAGGVTVEPGAIVGNDVSADAGVRLTGRVPTESVVRRG